MTCLSRFVIGSSFVALAAACTTQPTVEEVVDKSTPVVCEKVKECSGEITFAAAYPGGVDDCVTRTKAEAKKKYGDDLDARSVCTDEELDRCLDDLRAGACPADGSPPTPPCKC